MQWRNGKGASAAAPDPSRRLSARWPPYSAPANRDMLEKQCHRGRRKHRCAGGRVMRPVEIAPELPEFLRKAENRQFLEFHEYWLRKSADKAMPARADIDPVDIPQLLADVFLVDVVAGNPCRFRFRLVGTRIAELEGEITNKYLDEF